MDWRDDGLERKLPSRVTVLFLSFFLSFFFFSGKEYMIQHAGELRLCILIGPINQEINQHPFTQCRPCAQHS